MPWFPAVPPALAAADGAGPIVNNKKRAAGLPRLLHKLFIKVLRLRPASLAAEEEYCYYYSYGGAGLASWAGVLSSIPEEDYDDDDDSSNSEGEEEVVGTPDVVVVPGPAAAVLRKPKSERILVVGPPDDAAATVVHVEVLV